MKIRNILNKLIFFFDSEAGRYSAYLGLNCYSFDDPLFNNNNGPLASLSSLEIWDQSNTGCFIDVLIFTMEKKMWFLNSITTYTKQ